MGMKYCCGKGGSNVAEINGVAITAFSRQPYSSDTHLFHNFAINFVLDSHDSLVVRL